MGKADTVAGRLVLVVDDSEDILELYEVVLSTAGYSVAVASSGRIGLELVGRLHPAVVILDMMMPDVDGLEFLAELHRYQPPPPVIVNSGFDALEQQARARGAHVFLRKPVPPEELLAAVERVLNGREDPERERAHAAAIEAGRAQAKLTRAQFWARMDLEEPELRRFLNGILAWLTGYIGFGRAFVDLLYGDKIYVEAGKLAGIAFNRELAYCSDCIDAGSSLLIPDTMSHPVFSKHKALAYFGARFYVGSPITTRENLVLGTVCVIDTVPRQFGPGDMRILEYLAHRIGRHLEALAQGRRPTPFFEPPMLFERDAIDIILDAQIAATADVHFALVTFAGGSPARLARAAAVIYEVADGARLAAAHHPPETLAFVWNGAPSWQVMERALHEAGLVPDAVGVAAYGPGASPHTRAPLLSAAEAARSRSAALVRTVVSEMHVGA